MKRFFALILFGLIPFCTRSQSTIEPCPCLMKVDPRLKVRCGYLVAPENRKKPFGNKVKVPFIFARKPEQDSTKNIVLYTTGGPGYATISRDDSLQFTSDFFSFGGFILFDQRGTKNAIPCLDCEGIDEAIRTAYRHNLRKDSLIGVAVKQCRQKFTKKGIDLSAYTTEESAADIADLRRLLKIDSITLFGLSYSGGLMLTVLRNHPQGIKSLILNSPLPAYVNYEEHALFNHNEALNELFDFIEKDSVLRRKHPNLKKRFQDYFTFISGKRFSIQYTDKTDQRVYTIEYTKNELLDAIINQMNNAGYQLVPDIISDLVKGDHSRHITQVLDQKFWGNKNLSFGMRLSVYCSEQIAWSDEEKVNLQDKVLPWLAGYPFNSPNHEICDCWKVTREPEYLKTPVYSLVPAIISAGAFDPWTRPFYNELIRRTMPNAQLIVLKNRAHVAGFGSLLKPFMKDPYKKLHSTSATVVVD